MSNRDRFQSRIIRWGTIGIGLVCIVSAFSDDLPALIQQSIEATRTLPYEGRCVYKRMVRSETWEADLIIRHASAALMQVEVVTPEHAKGLVILRSQNAIWASSSDPEKKERLRKETSFVPWPRLFHSGQSVEFDDIQLLAKNYALIHSGTESIAGHDAVHITITPNQKKHPSLQLWVDAKSKIQLKYERYTHQGALLESSVYQSLQVNPIFQEEWFSTDGLDRLFPVPDTDKPPEIIPLDFSPYNPSWLPSGFEKRGEYRWKGESGVVLNTSYSDGLANLSIFQRRQTKEEIEKAAKEQEKEKSKDKCPIINRFDRGGRDIFFREENGLRISAVADLPDYPIIQTLMHMQPSPEPESATATIVAPSK